MRSYNVSLLASLSVFFLNVFSNICTADSIRYLRSAMHEEQWREFIHSSSS